MSEWNTCQVSNAALLTLPRIPTDEYLRVGQCLLLRCRVAQPRCTTTTLKLYQEIHMRYCLNYVGLHYQKNEEVIPSVQATLPIALGGGRYAAAGGVACATHVKIYDRSTPSSPARTPTQLAGRVRGRIMQIIPSPSINELRLNGAQIDHSTALSSGRSDFHGKFGTPKHRAVFSTAYHATQLARLLERGLRQKTSKKRASEN